MPDFCTCGAELPPDARFCHKCGKPQREELPTQVAEVPPVAMAPPIVVATPATPPRLNFRNRAAVRIGLLTATIASLLSALPVVALGLMGLLLWWLTAGFFAAFLYRRSTGQRLSVDGGLRMGWITGLLGSTITAVLFTISAVPLIRGGEIGQRYAEQVRQMAGTDASVQQALKVLETPGGLALIIVMALLFSFLMITFLCTAGGALGAKLVGGTPAARQ